MQNESQIYTQIRIDGNVGKWYKQITIILSRKSNNNSPRIHSFVFYLWFVTIKKGFFLYNILDTYMLAVYYYHMCLTQTKNRFRLSYSE